MAFALYGYRDYAGAAVPSGLTAPLANTYTSGQTFTIQNPSTWLNLDGNALGSGDGTSGIGPFVVAVDYGAANEEKILCSSINIGSGVVTVWTDGTNNGRGYDGTTPQSHVLGAICAPVFSATEADEANNTVYSTLGQIAAAGDLLQGNGNKSLAKLSAGANGTVLTSNGPGNALSWQATGNPSGTILDFAGSTAPTGYLLCDGSSYSTTTYAALYAALGGSSSPWGTGSGTFNVPDLRGRVTAGVGAVGTNTQPSLSLAGTGGQQQVTLTIAQMPSHQHTDSGHTHFIIGAGANIGGSGARTPTIPSLGSTGYETVTNAQAQITPTGGGGSHENMMPYAAVTKIIKY
jgi:microcystin-dependent protein